MTLTVTTAGPGRQAGVQGGFGKGAMLTVAAGPAVSVPVARGGAVTATAGVPLRVGVPLLRDSTVTLAGPGKAGTSPAAGVPGTRDRVVRVTLGVPAGVLRRCGRVATLAVPGTAGTSPVAGGHGRAVTVKRGARAGKATLCRAGQTATQTGAGKATRPGWRFQTR